VPAMELRIGRTHGMKLGRIRERKKLEWSNFPSIEGKKGGPERRIKQLSGR